MSESLEYARFAPRRARIVPAVTAVAFMIMMVVLAFTSPGSTMVDVIAFLGCGLLVAWLMWRLAGVHAIPTEQGLLIRNLFVTTRLDWAQIVTVRFGDRPWPQLDLSDGDTVAVMAIQRADGEAAQQEAVRLANLVEEHGAPDR